MNEIETISNTKLSRTKGGENKSSRKISVEKRNISISKNDSETLELIDSILSRCNQARIGRLVTLSDIFIYAIRKLKDADYDLIKESILTPEEKAHKALLEFNTKNGTNLTMIELAIKQLKKEKKETLQ
jgi:hypothetical protein